jgi:SAM-dependent methyltransferase
MGITSNCATFLTHARNRGVDFSKTVMLGRQQLYIKKEIIKGLFSQSSVDKVITSKYAEPFFEALGAEKVDSLDYSDYEQAALIYDLNKPLPDTLKNSYTVVFDGGTLEHVFNFPVAIKNCMDMVEPGGHFVAITPCNNQCGHGLYQFSPELYYSIFSETHGFIVKIMYLAVDIADDEREWYEVARPETVKSRVVFKNSSPTYLMVVAKKVSVFTGELTPYQSDYQEIWSNKHEAESHSGMMIRFYRVLVPAFIRAKIYQLRHRHKHKEVSTKGLGNVNKGHFKRVNIG